MTEIDLLQEISDKLTILQDSNDLLYMSVMDISGYLMYLWVTTIVLVLVVIFFDN